MTADEIRELWVWMTPAERAELDAIVAADMAARRWLPLPPKGTAALSPQARAWASLADITGYGGAAGGGKGLALSTPLATPHGWTTMGAVEVGDVLFDDQGAPCRVTAVSATSMRPCYRLVFDDGSVLVADDVHRWLTYDAKELAKLWRAARRAQRPSRAKATTSPARLAALQVMNSARGAAPPPAGTVRDTANLATTLLTAAGRRNHAIQVAVALAQPDAPLPVPPYVLGAWLGDGSSRNGQLTGVDAYIWERIGADGYEVRHYEWNEQAHSIIGLKVQLAALGVLANKHIPKNYLRASYAQRLALLQGLMDTDGHAALDGGCEFDSTNEALALGVRELVSTLGIKSTMQRGTAKLNGRAVGPKWRVKFTTSVPVFGMPRKAARLKAATRRTAQFRYLVSCEPVDTMPTRCIAVDSQSRLYLAGETLIPTHNTDLIAGLVQDDQCHERALIVRREKAQTIGIVQRLTEIIGGTDGYNSQQSVWRIPGGALTEFAGLDNPGDERRWQGRPHDLKAFDEVTEMREQQVRFIMGWRRTSNPRLRARVLMTFNPPTTDEGRWVIAFFGPWLDKTHPLYPTPPGVLRWCAMLPDGLGGSKDRWLDDGRRFVLMADGSLLYDFNPADYSPEQIITPLSRTFIPARVTDNPFYMETGYMSTLQSLPEPLRSQMLYGDFQAGITDDAWQVIPTAWVEAAQARWKPRAPRGEMLAMGVDVARGGKDRTTLATRHKDEQAGHGKWFDKLRTHPGTETPDGPKVAGLVVADLRDSAPVMIDAIGVGASPYDILNTMRLQVLGVIVSEKATGTDRSGRLSFANLRSQLWWKMREDLDPANDTGIALPPEDVSPGLRRELCMPKWSLSGFTIQVESREDIIKRLGASPDQATAVILANMDVPKRAAMDYASAADQVLSYNPLEQMRGHDPMRF